VRRSLLLVSTTLALHVACNVYNPGVLGVGGASEPAGGGGAGSAAGGVTESSGGSGAKGGNTNATSGTAQGGGTEPAPSGMAGDPSGGADLGGMGGMGGDEAAGTGGVTTMGGSSAGSATAPDSAGASSVELAHGMPTTADSEQNTSSKMNPATSGNDGDAATRWCAADGNPHYWQVDLATAHALERVEIDFEYPTKAQGLPYLYVVSVSDDGSAFTPVIDKSANTDVTTTQTADFPALTHGRYVRISVTPPVTTPSATWASFWEARIYGE
jgi:hypothetical protein